MVVFCEGVFPKLAFSSPSIALVIPGTSSSALVLSASAGGPAAGSDKLDPRFAAILSQAKVSKAHIDLLGDADCESAVVFGHIARAEEKFITFLRGVLNLDQTLGPRMPSRSPD